MDMTFDYQKFREDKLVTKVNDEIKFYSESDYCEDYPVKNYIDYLKDRIGVGPLTTKPYTSYYTQNTNTFKTMVMDEYSKDMDIHAFARPWKGLREIHRITKITEFVNALEYKTQNKVAIDKNRQLVIKELCEGLKAKRFVKNKNTIEYDETEMRIVAISCLEKKKNNFYTVAWE